MRRRGVRLDSPDNTTVLIDLPCCRAGALYGECREIRHVPWRTPHLGLHKISAGRLESSLIQFDLDSREIDAIDKSR